MARRPALETDCTSTDAFLALSVNFTSRKDFFCLARDRQSYVFFLVKDIAHDSCLLVSYRPTMYLEISFKVVFFHPSAS